MREVNNNPTGNPQPIPQVKAKKIDASCEKSPDAAFTGKELELTNDPAFQALVSADNTSEDLNLLQKNHKGVKTALAFQGEAEKKNSYEDSVALMGEFTKEFLEG